MRKIARRGAISPLTVAAAGLVIALCATLPAFAAGAFNPSTEPAFIAGIVVLLVTGRLFGEVMQRLGQPAVMGQLLAGILLSPSVFGILAPHFRALVFPSGGEQKSMLEAISQLGILMLLLLTGMETDLALVRKVRTPALLVALFGIALPFACGFALGEYLPSTLLSDPGKRLLSALFLGTALSISSIKIVAMVVQDMNFMRRNLGQIIVAAAIVEDTAGWIVISFALALAAHGKFDAMAFARSLVGITLFLAASFTVGRPLVFQLIRRVNDSFESEFAVITAILVVMGALALITAALGLQTVLGAFVAGVLVGESPILTRHIDAQLRGLIVALFMPVFFGLAGLGADLTILGNPQLLLLTLALILIASAGKFGGAWAGARLGGLNTREAIALGCAMNARGSTEIIVASIGVTAGALTQTLFTMIVAMAMLTTAVMPPMLRRALSGLPMGSEERSRLEREATDARGFVSSLERLLLAIDASATGKPAARLAGLIAGARGMPITIVELKTQASRSTAGAHEAAANAVQSGAAAGEASLREETSADIQRKVHISHEREKHDRGLAEIAGKGFDLLFVGIAESRTAEGHFSRKLTRVVEGYRDTLALLVAEGAGTLPETGARILLPVTGTAASRRGAEIAFVLGRALEARITAIYVTRWHAAASRRSRNARLSMTRRNEEAVLKDIVRLGSRYGVEVRTEIEAHSSPDSPILKRASAHDLIVMGVNRRPGDVLFLGNTAAAILAHHGGPTLFIADPE